MDAFSELVDPAHFEQACDSVEECLRDSYDKAGWKKLGGWINSGPEH